MPPVPQRITMINKWITKDKKRIFTSPILSLDLSKRYTSDGREGEFVTLDLPNSVSIIPFKRREDGEAVFIMENQYRFGSESVTREFPAGLIEEGETAREGAIRELREETGLEGDLVELASFNPNPSFMTNRQTFFLATNLHKVSEQSLDPNEEIEVVEVPVEEVIRDMGKDPYSNGIMMAALFAFMRKREYCPELRSNNYEK